MSDFRRSLLVSSLFVLACLSCATTAAAWVWSYLDRGYLPPSGTTTLCLARGRLTLYHLQWLTPLPNGCTVVWDRRTMGRIVGGVMVPPQDGLLASARLRNGFGFCRNSVTVGGPGIMTFRVDALAVPMWLGVLITASFAMWAGMQLRRQPKSESGFCATCGYDLRATPRRCPECGMAVESVANVASGGSRARRA